MARFCTLFSGSSGNSTYIAASDSAVLVDAGRSCKQLLAAMESRGIEPRSIGAVLVTHEHTDHVSGLRVLLKKLGVPLYARLRCSSGCGGTGCSSQGRRRIRWSRGRA